jgi:pimeloyl-ACP methyl ester carboxylesterase
MLSKATIMLVHGDMAESASWDGVIPKLLAQGYPVGALDNIKGVLRPGPREKACPCHSADKSLPLGADPASAGANGHPLRVHAPQHELPFPQRNAL